MKKIALISLEDWIAFNYSGAGTPSVHTVRRWIREGHISPLPQKHGRSYYLQPDACYVVQDRVPHAA